MRFILSWVWLLAYAEEICYNFSMEKVMKKSKYILIILIFSILVVALTGCSAKYEYTPTKDRVEIYNSTESSSDYIDCSVYSTEYADYYFETTLKDKQKDNFVDTAEQILNDYPMEKVKFVIGTSFNTAYVGEVHNAKHSYNRSIDTFYFNINDLSNINLLAELNAKRYGEKIPYGLLYAYSYGQCKASKYDIPKALGNSKLKEAVNNNKDITDLNTFVFLSSFTADTEKSAAQTLSIKLYELLGSQELQKIIEIADLKEQQRILNLHLKTVCYKNGITTQFDMGVKDYCFYHTQKYIVAENSNMGVRFFIDVKYKALLGELETYLTNYADLKTIFVKSIPSFEKVNAFVGNRYFESADFYISNDFGWGQTYGNYCNMCSCLELTHEYTHIALWGKDRSDWNWTAEVIACYCDTMFSDYETEYLLYSLTKYHSIGQDEQAKKAYELLLKYQPIDKTELWDILGYVYECFNPNQDLGGVTWRLPERISPSFCNYLMENYGKEKFMQICTTSYSTEIDIYGKTLEQLRSDWFATMQAKYE